MAFNNKAYEVTYITTEHLAKLEAAEAWARAWKNTAKRYRQDFNDYCEEEFAFLDRLSTAESRIVELGREKLQLMKDKIALAEQAETDMKEINDLLEAYQNPVLHLPPSDD